MRQLMENSANIGTNKAVSRSQNRKITLLFIHSTGYQIQKFSSFIVTSFLKANDMSANTISARSFIQMLFVQFQLLLLPAKPISKTSQFIQSSDFLLLFCPFLKGLCNVSVLWACCASGRVNKINCKQHENIGKATAANYCDSSVQLDLEDHLFILGRVPASWWPSQFLIIRN